MWTETCELDSSIYYCPTSKLQLQYWFHSKICYKVLALQSVNYSQTNSTPAMFLLWQQNII